MSFGTCGNPNMEMISIEGNRGLEYRQPYIPTSDSIHTHRQRPPQIQLSSSTHPSVCRQILPQSYSSFNFTLALTCKDSYIFLFSRLSRAPLWLPPHISSYLSPATCLFVAHTMRTTRKSNPSSQTTCIPLPRLPLLSPLAPTILPLFQRSTPQL